MRLLILGLFLTLAACTPTAPDATGEAGRDAAPTAPAAGDGPAEAGATAPPADSPDAAAATDATDATAATDTATVDPDAPPPAPPATLRGRVAYPSESLPAMRVCALATEDPGLGYCTDTAVNAPHFEVKLPGGTWWLLAWPRGTGTEGSPGLFSEASDCLGSGGVGCDDHSLREITVDSGEVREGLDINDWYYEPEATPLPVEPRGEPLD